MSYFQFDNRLDEIDRQILEKRSELYNRLWCPRVGDYVQFADGILRRISHIWGYGFGFNDLNIQTSDKGNYYLGDGFITMSGSSYPSIPSTSLILSSKKRIGSVWFFHHDWHQAYNVVDTTIMFRVYNCNLEAPK